MRRYYFAYHLVCGNPYAFMWAEEDGLPVGGIPEIVPGTRVEVTVGEWTTGTLNDLMKQYPHPSLVPPIAPGDPEPA